MSHRFLEGVDIVKSGRWLGNANVATTSIDAELDLESQRKALRLAKSLLNTDHSPR